MRKGSDIIGRSVVDYETGERFSSVKDLLFDQNNNQLLGLLVKEAGLFSSAKVIPLESVQAIGPDAVVVPSKGSVIRATDVPDLKQIVKRDNVLRGTYILTTDGRNLGRMIDLFFDDQTGKVEGYEVSGGLFADAYSGRSFVPAPQTLKIGEHFAFVPTEVADLMEEQVGGIRGAMLAAGERVQTAAQTTSERLQIASAEATARLQEASRRATASVVNAMVDPAEQKDFVVGRIAQQDVTAPDGRLIVARGQIVGLTDAEIAEEQGVLDLLYQAAGGDASQHAGERFRLAANSTNQRLQTAAESASEQLRLAAEQASQRYQELSRNTSESFTNALIRPEEQKNAAIGKVAGWTVTDPTGTVVVLGGQEVAPGMADAAERLGVLDELYRATGGKVSNELSRRADTIAASYAAEEALGHRVHQTVRTRDGIIIAASGQIVTESVLERARAYHKQAELLEAVGLSPRTAIRGRADSALVMASDRFDTTARTFSDRLRQGTEDVKVEVRDLWERLRIRANGVQERNARRWEEQRINSVLGRPVTRVILDRNDDVILNVGDLITHQAIAEARAAGVLDVVLNSAYSKTPEFTRDELRAPVPGHASLEASKN